MIGSAQKRFIMRKSIIIVILAVGLASALSAVATPDGSYPAMIREDRVWEYLWTRAESTKYGWPTDCELFRMKFDGTEEKNGKEYHRFVYCGDRVKWKETTDMETGAVTRTDKVTTPNEDTTVYFLREESGKVFVLFPYDEFHDLGNGYKAEKDEEVPLYDFTLGEGESFAGFWSWGAAGGLTDYPVRELEPIDIAGDRCRVFGVTDSFIGACREYCFSEAAGCLNCGILAAPDAILRPSGYTSIECDLQKIYDGDGNVIYDSSRFAEKRMTMINEDRTWIYRSHSQDHPVVIQEMKFTDSRELNGFTYHRFALVKLSGYDREGHLVSEENLTDGPGYWLREYSGRTRVWLLTDGSRSVDDISSTDPSKLQELLIYDFSLIDGSEFRCPLYPDDFSESACVTVTISDEDEPMEIDGQKCRVQKIDDPRYDSIRYINGIGTVYNGSLATPCIGNISGSVDNPVLPGIQSLLLAVRDGDGNVLYEYDPSAGIAPEVSGSPLRHDGDRVLAEGEGELTLRLFAADGRRAGTASGSGKVSLSLDGVAPGVYIATVIGTDGARHTLRIVK